MSDRVVNANAKELEQTIAAKCGGDFGGVMRFSDFVTLQRGFDLPKTEMQDGPYPVLGSTSIIGFHSDFKVEPPGVVTGRSGSLGVVQFVAERYWPHNTSLWVKDFKGNDAKFVYYCMKGLDFARFNAGAGVPTLNRNHLDSLEVEVPPLHIQRRIASILSAHDELIENNQRRIKILESMARALYREWFVHFRFPGYESVPRVASPLGEIPQGWEVRRLGDLITYSRRATMPGPRLEERRYVQIDCLPPKSLVLLEAKPIREAQSSLQLFEKGDILFGAMRPYFHKVVVAPFPGVTRTTCFVFRPLRPEWHAFATMTAFDDATVAYANAHSQGATIPYAVWDGSLSEMPLVLPSTEVLQQFETAVAPILVWLAQSFFALGNLRRTRDLLLPRLLSGQIDVEAMPS